MSLTARTEHIPCQSARECWKDGHEKLRNGILIFTLVAMAIMFFVVMPFLLFRKHREAKEDMESEGRGWCEDVGNGDGEGGTSRKQVKVENNGLGPFGV